MKKRTPFLSLTLFLGASLSTTPVALAQTTSGAEAGVGGRNATGGVGKSGPRGVGTLGTGQTGSTGESERNGRNATSAPGRNKKNRNRSGKRAVGNPPETSSKPEQFKPAGKAGAAPGTATGEIGAEGGGR